MARTSASSAAYQKTNIVSSTNNIVAFAFLVNFLDIAGKSGSPEKEDLAFVPRLSLLLKSLAQNIDRVRTRSIGKEGLLTIIA
jgi:hypothetical protein